MKPSHCIARCFVIVIVLGRFTGDVRGQMQNESGKAWKTGNQTGAEYVQMVVTQSSGANLAGIVSIRSQGLWQGEKEKEFTGIQSNVSGFVRFDCTCEDGMQFFGWLWTGITRSRADDRIAVYFRPIASVQEIEDCHPDTKTYATEATYEQIQ